MSAIAVTRLAQCYKCLRRNCEDMDINTIKVKLSLLFIALFAIVSLGAATTERTVYSQLSNKELKQKSIQLVKNVRSLVESYKKQDRELMAQYDKKDRSNLNKKDRSDTSRGAHAARQQWLKDSDQVLDSTMRYYKDHYWADAILLIGELNRRNPKGAKQTSLLRLYQHPTNVLGLAAVADHLELHSKSLPDA